MTVFHVTSFICGALCTWLPVRILPTVHDLGIERCPLVHGDQTLQNPAKYNSEIQLDVMAKPQGKQRRLMMERNTPTLQRSRAHHH